MLLSPASVPSPLILLLACTVLHIGHGCLCVGALQVAAGQEATRGAGGASFWCPAQLLCVFPFSLSLSFVSINVFSLLSVCVCVCVFTRFFPCAARWAPLCAKVFEKCPPQVSAGFLSKLHSFAESSAELYRTGGWPPSSFSSPFFFYLSLLLTKVVRKCVCVCARARACMLLLVALLLMLI